MVICYPKLGNQMNKNTNSARFSRRHMLQFGAGVVGTGTLTAWLGSGVLSQIDTAAVADEMKKAAAKITPDQALKMLMDGNKRFANGRPQNPHRSLERLKEVAPHQEPFAAVLSCADSRVLPEVLFDQGIGDIFDVRVAGNVATVEELASEEYAVAALGVKVLMVLGHERCGAVKAAVTGGSLPGSVGKLVKLIEPAVVSSAQQSGDKLANAVKANVLLQMKNLQASPVIAQFVQEGKLQVVGAYYDLDTGVVSMLS
jgi:carbonic anhydrase